MEFEDTGIIHETLKSGADFFITDKWKSDLHFKIATFTVPTGLLSEAIEVIKDERPEPYIFSILSPFDVDIESAELELKAKIKRGINKRYLVKDDERGYDLNNKDDEMVGRISWNSANEASLVIDGIKITMKQLGRILSAFEGFQFRLQIREPSDEF